MIFASPLFALTVPVAVFMGVQIHSSHFAIMPIDVSKLDRPSRCFIDYYGAFNPYVPYWLGMFWLVGQRCEDLSPGLKSSSIYLAPLLDKFHQKK